jgi:serine/threonine-protein kinase
MEDGALYIAMEYVSGKDLHQVLTQEWPLPEARVVRIVSQVLSALADAHGAGVIHRDLKPENIMLEQRRNEADFVKVLDFGIAKILDDRDEGPALTRAGFVCGTPEYMSPEQARGATLDPRSDLYAVGVILYQLMTGLLPFESDSAVGFATKHLNEEPPPPTRRRPEAKISAGLERVILRALAKHPDDRPQTAEAFREELMALAKAPRPAGAARRALPSPALAPSPRRDTPKDGGATDAMLAWHDSTVRTAPDAGPKTDTVDVLVVGRAATVFKVITLLLVLASGVLLTYYVRQEGGMGAEPEAYVPPANAPVPVTMAQPAPAAPPPLYEQEPTRAASDSSFAQRLARDGDLAHHAGNLDAAITKYREAFAKSGDPELALKLGELHYQRRELDEARGWWMRHLRDRADSKAKRYIQHALANPR